MRAILIDPELRTVSNIELRHHKGNAALKEMCAIIGCDGMDHALISDMHDTIWVDEHGLLRGKPIHAFRLSIVREPFAGKGIVVGADNHGRAAPPYFPIELLRQEIIWLGLIVPEVQWFDEGDDHHRAVVTYSRAK